MMNKIPWLAFLFCLLAVCAAAQTFEDSAAFDPSQNRAGQTHVKPDAYVLGPDDALRISVLEAPESSTERMLIDSEGQITLPMTGRFQAAGLPVRDLEDEVRRRFTPYIHEPHVSVSLVAPRAQTVSVIGAVGKPGVHSIRGPTPLVEVLSLAGGLREDAGHRIKISRTTAGPLPPFVEGSDNASVAEVDVKAIMEASNPAQSIMVLPHDVVSVPRAEMVYVIGAVERSGGFVLEEREQISVIQALSLAGGTTGIAAPK
jgi:polysaccharide export outer membrane protein